MLAFSVDYALGQSNNLMQLVKSNRGAKNIIKVAADHAIPKRPLTEAHLRNTRAITKSGTNAEAYWSNDGCVVFCFVRY